ncbi:MAG: hypothetical protein E8A49_14400 [Phenylobacterium sp.]|nr:MAG: hypothetical protein E8A49_14400 [Phenylobacterium sp.]
MSVVLVPLAAGFRLDLAGPWPASTGRIDRLTPVLGAWMIVVQVLSAGLGGSLAGRLRTKWTNVHGHEVHFRDTALALLAWAATAPADAAVWRAGTVRRSCDAGPLVGGFQEPAISNSGA